MDERVSKNKGPHMVVVMYSDKKREIFGPYEGAEQAQVAARAMHQFARSIGMRISAVTAPQGRADRRRHA